MFNIEVNVRHRVSEKERERKRVNMFHLKKFKELLEVSVE